MHKDELEKAFIPAHDKGEKIEKCGQPLDPKELPYVHEHDFLISRIDGCPRKVKFSPPGCNLVPSNPFASLKQNAYMHMHPEILGKKGLKEWESKTDYSNLPEKVRKKKGK